MRFRRGGSERSRPVDLARLERAYREALAALLDDEPDRAEAALAEVVRDDSSQVDVYLALGQLYRRRGEIARAIRVHQNLLLRSDLPAEKRDRALRGLARDFRKGGFLQRAIAAYEELRGRRGRDPEALEALTRLRADTRDFDAALDAHKRWARVTGESPQAGEAALWRERADAARAEGRSDVARRALTKSLRIDPQQALTWVRLGELEAERGKPKKAIAAWRKALEADRRMADTVYPRLEVAYADLGRGDRYERELRERVAAHADDLGARLALARLLASRGDLTPALAEIEAVLAQDPERLDVHAARAQLLLESGRDGELAKTLAGLLEVLERGGYLTPREPLG